MLKKFVFLCVSTTFLGSSLAWANCTTEKVAAAVRDDLSQMEGSSKFRVVEVGVPNRSIPEAGWVAVNIVKVLEGAHQGKRLAFVSQVNPADCTVYRVQSNLLLPSN